MTPLNHKQTENELLLQVAAGDGAAFTRFYHLFEQRVYRIAFGYFQNAEEAEEVVQDVFLKIHRSAAGYNGQAAAATWVYKIAVNKCLDRIRYNNARKRFSFITSIFGGDNGELKHDVADSSHHGMDADKREDVSILLKAMEKLPVQQRTALMLTQIEELSGKETAAIMNVTPKAVEGLIQRGKAGLRKILGNFYDGRG